MLLGSDELGRTQGGNNNAYCQDNEISWYDWSNVDGELLAFVQRLVALRRAEPALRPEWYREAPGEDVSRGVRLLRTDGNEFTEADWADPEARAATFVLMLEGADSFALMVNAAENGVEFALPPHADAWSLELSSDPELPEAITAPALTLAPMSFALLRSPSEVAEA